MYLYKMFTDANMANNRSGVKLVFIFAVSAHALLASVFLLAKVAFLSQLWSVPFNSICTKCSKMITWLTTNVNKH